MSEINVISRLQHIIIDPASTVVSVINGPAKGAVPTTGLPVVSGLVHRGTAVTNVPVGANGVNVLLDPTTGQVQKVGSDVEIVNAGAATYQMRVKQTGLYHVFANARCPGTAPTAGSLMGIRVNGNAVMRATFDAAAYASAIVSGPLYLTRDDLVSMFAYSTGGTITLDPVAQTQIDPPSPILSIWRMSTVQLVP
jgi:hypothetical protein